jgi:hypothetical protein
LCQVGELILNRLQANPGLLQRLIGQFIQAAVVANPDLAQSMEGSLQIVQNHPALITTFMQQSIRLLHKELEPKAALANLLDYLAGNPQVIQDLIGVWIQTAIVINPKLMSPLLKVQQIVQNHPHLILTVLEQSVGALRGEIQPKIAGATVLTCLAGHPEIIQDLIEIAIQISEIETQRATEAYPELARPLQRVQQILQKDQAIIGIQQIVRNYPALITTVLQQAAGVLRGELQPTIAAANLMAYIEADLQIIKDLIGIAILTGDSIPPQMQLILHHYQNNPGILQGTVNQIEQTLRNANEPEEAFENIMNQVLPQLALAGNS